MQFFKVTSFENAVKTVKDNLPFKALKAEEVELYSALGRRAFEDVFADEDLPEYNRSTVDGYAVKAANTYGASESIPSMLHLVGAVGMGEVGTISIKAGETVYVPTGGAVPEGADAMVMLEDTQVFDDNVAFYRPASKNDNVISIGDDVSCKDVILKRGERITPLKSGLLAALGKATVKVLPRLKVAVISTGDEIVAIDEKHQIGQIRDTNTAINCALCENNGFETVSTARIKDGFDLLDDALLDALKKADVVLVSGGSSIGARDFTERVFEKEGEILVHGIALKPGKPTLIGRAKNKLVLGLPGHPMACLLTLKLLLIDAFNALCGDGEAPYVFAKCTTNFPSSPGRLTVQPLSLEYAIDGVKATPIFYKSGLVSVLARADGYALLPPESEGVDKDATVKAYLL